MRLPDSRHAIDRAVLVYRRCFAALAVFSGVINLLVLAPTLYMLQVYDRVLVSRNETTLLMLTIILLGLFLLNSGLEWVRSQLMVSISAGLDDVLSEQVFDAAFRRSLQRTGGNPAQALQDLANLRQFLTGPGLIALFDVPWLPLYLAISFLFHPVLGVFALAGALLMIALAIWNEIATHQGLVQANGIAVQSSAQLNNTLQNAEVIEAMGMQATLRRRWRQLQDAALAAQAGSSARAARIAALTRFVRMSLQSLALGLGATLVLDGSISGGMMIAVTLLVGRTVAPVEQAIASWKNLGSARTSYQRLNTLLEQLPPQQSPMPLPAPTGAVSVERLVVVPPGSRKAVLAAVHFALQPGELLAIVGASASGKSSLLRALLGIWPAASGVVRLDGADIRQWSREALGPRLGYLPQDIELFDGSIAENIARFGEVDAEKVIAAARLAGIHDMVLQFVNGYDTRIGGDVAQENLNQKNTAPENNVMLSGGQKQRIGLARALYGQPALVVLDEPNAHLDEAGEQALAAALQVLKQAGSTVVVVTHRANLLPLADKMLFLKDGEQKLFGPREQVMKTLMAPASALRSASGERAA